ncbi:hypothetical protein B0T14DRAFT_567512 [Immersiella caudata]|uniref:Uncharacterized protein n=1 Tax=Immersiella caudata TaxID=314043 RepID=A0AA39WSI3_9PEZI|nr:hypothetical protein B0T14DRAFT_567512 [Immersiella caudata]
MTVTAMTVTAMTVITDFILALLPLTFVFQLLVSFLRACVSCLQRLAETWLRRVGLISTQKTQPTYYADQPSRKRTMNQSAIQHRDETVVEFDEVPIVDRTPHSSKNQLSDEDRRYEAWSVVDRKA